MNRFIALSAQILAVCAIASIAAADCSSDKDACIQQCSAARAWDFHCANSCFDLAQDCAQRESDPRQGMDNAGLDGGIYYSSLDQDGASSSSDRSSPAIRTADREDDRSSDLSRCAGVSYDPDMHHLFTFHNTCKEKIHINFICRSCGEHTDSVMVLRPGQKKSTEDTPQDVDRKGGYSVAVCRGGYMAVGTDGGDWGPDRQYRCKKIWQVKNVRQEDEYSRKDSPAGPAASLGYDRGEPVHSLNTDLRDMREISNRRDTP